MRIHVLGTGTSTGVPVPGCHCQVCLSGDSKNQRLRTSVLLQSGSSNLLIDSSTDLRLQALRAGITRIDAVLYTHTHADHIFGIDDLRPFNFLSKSAIPVYSSETSALELEKIFYYAFNPDPAYQGGAPPQLTLNRLVAYQPCTIAGLEILPLPILHGDLEVFGFRVGNFAYLTDCSEIPEKTYQFLEQLDLLILDGLRVRPHPTHFTHEQAVREAERLRPKMTYLTHISHEVDHFAANRALSTMATVPVELAYDGLIIDL